MAFDNSFTAIVGATYTAAQYNTHVRDNFTAVWVYTTAGDIVYATSATALARLAKPSVDSLLKNTSSGVPSWLSIAALPGRLHTYGENYSNSGSTSASTSYAAIGAGVYVDLTLASICTVIAFAFGAGTKNSGSSDGYFGISIDGTQDPNDKNAFRGVTNTPFATMYHKASVPVGTRRVELKYKTANAADTVGFSMGLVAALAFIEG